MKSSYYPRSRATIGLLYRILTTATTIWNALTEVTSEANIIARVVLQGNIAEYYSAREMRLPKWRQRVRLLSESYITG